ncbi:geranylgeranyl pyrophosphate synthase [Paenibacillus cellulosilyticus]|uniref:Geranylgeranyl pyrophosphate synthase n=1 Tax=Paenibacillus cellulosilyticus TaxID=375489 RepID=A0A2V2YUQ2_9BACL|nr:polyprenyl synthetase family protein [Paenibacillus cellulosilyticus]PWW04840.1 geranylgeranyl pyrophosphate synthase [Paenibacillus cellulosilyticus]QKS45954.1 polyprenyl synthetase family protein [Paenibacillus cellulosilyticus]
MNVQFIVHADTRYGLAEHQAAQYFAKLHEQLQSKSYITALTEDIQQWKRSHIRSRSWVSFLTRGRRKSNAADYHRYIQWLNHTDKLEAYLDRSVSYIYMRDLGMALDDPKVKTRIQRVVTDVKHRLTRSAETGRGETPTFISMVELYRWAQKEGIETAVIWALGKLKNVADHIPEGMNAEHAQRKLIKIIVGVVMHAVEALTEQQPPSERSRRLDEAIRLGYSYGLTYPFVDDLLDAQVLSKEEKAQYSRMIREALLSGTVPAMSEWGGPSEHMLRFIHAELREAFEYIKNHQQSDTQQLFFEQAYVFFHSQEIDRAKAMTNATYTNEELYIPIILKSASSRLIARSVLDTDEDEGFEYRTFHYGIYNQLADDFADLFDDQQEGAVTPFTYYLAHREQRSDLINPFELYWTVITHLIHDVYHNDPKAREVILNRAINGLKRCKMRLGKEAYNRLMAIFAPDAPAFNRLIQQMVRQADDVEFFDKLIRDQLVSHLREEGKQKDQFAETVRVAKEQINSTLQIAKSEDMLPMKEMLIDAANYSLAGDGKRLRPVLTWVMGVHEFGLQASSIVPLLRSLEYMHTASLIFDDLPSQDNADIRRGRATLHQVYDSATAELTGLLLIQRATQEQASLHGFDPNHVLALIRYSAQKAEELCAGQAMDLSAKKMALTQEQLNAICYYKTGIAFEAALVMPAILAQVNEQEIAGLKAYAYHAGIAFQIKDDLLDAEGDAQLLGKPVGQDMENDRSTFVTVLGRDGANKAMLEHYCLAMAALHSLSLRTAFLEHLLNYIIHRDR